MHANRLGACLLLAAISLLALPARAEPTAHDRASASFQQARAAFARREFTAAAAAFEQAAEYEPHPVAWLNAAEAWARADDAVRATADCDRVLEDPRAAPPYRREAESRLEMLLPRVATLDLRGRTGSLASLDGGANFSLPARRRTTAGQHLLIVENAGTSRRFAIATRLGETTTLDTTPPEATPSPAPNAAEPTPAAASSRMTSHRGPPVGSWIAFGAAGAALVATTVFGLRTSAAKDDFEGAPSEHTRDAFYRERLLTNASLGVALIAAAAGVTIWVLSPARHRRPLALSFDGFDGTVATW